jgi:hypothetical protein
MASWIWRRLGDSKTNSAMIFEVGAHIIQRRPIGTAMGVAEGVLSATMVRRVHLVGLPSMPPGARPRGQSA